MATVLKVDPSFITLPGMEVVDTGYAATDLNVGDPVVISGDPPNRMYTSSVSAATGTEFHGFCVKTVKAGGFAEYAPVGEMDGYTGLTAGNSLTVVGGLLDDTEAGAGTHVTVRAINSSRIRFNLV